MCPKLLSLISELMKLSTNIEYAFNLDKYVTISKKSFASNQYFSNIDVIMRYSLTSLNGLGIGETPFA